MDNSVYCYGLQVNNGIPIIPFYNQKADRELLNLHDFLVGLGEVRDVRKAIAGYFRYDVFERWYENQAELVRRLFEALTIEDKAG